MAKLSPEALAYSAAALQSHDLKEALAVRNREYRQKEGTFDDSISRTMDFILTRTPAILADCPPEILEPLRVASAMMELWGVNNIRQFVTREGKLDYRFGTDRLIKSSRSYSVFCRRCLSYG